MIVRIAMIIVATLALCACSRGEPETAEPATPRPTIDTQEPKHPCQWLTTAEIVEVFGLLTGEPQRVGDAENWGTDEHGEACAYPVTTDRGVANLVVQLDLKGAPGFESVDEMMAGVVAAGMPTEMQVDAPVVEDRPEGWDYVGWVAGIRLYRVGHVAILMNVTNNDSEDESLDRIASLLRGKIADKPFSSPVNDAVFEESPGDPCDLITRAEAEAVLGKLSVAPYRSLKSGPLAHIDGLSCTYYSPSHRAFTVRPVHIDGKDQFNMSAGLGGLVRSKLGGADAADLLDGPWDSAAAGTSGEILFLQGDTLLEIFYATSATDIEGAAKLAAIAMPRLVKVASNR